MNTEEYYKGQRSLYNYCYVWGLNAYEFDILKRVTRRKKGQERQDLEKSLKVLEIYWNELLKHGQLSERKPQMVKNVHDFTVTKPQMVKDVLDFTVTLFIYDKELSGEEQEVLNLVLSIRNNDSDYSTKMRMLEHTLTNMINELDN